MRKHLAAIALALGLGLGTSACSDYLTGPKLSDNPNRPTVANNANLLVSAETNLSFQSESHLARTVCIWMQQCAGTNKQYLSLGLYNHAGKLGGVTIRTAPSLMVGTRDTDFFSIVPA